MKRSPLLVYPLELSGVVKHSVSYWGLFFLINSILQSHDKLAINIRVICIHVDLPEPLASYRSHQMTWGQEP